MEQALLYIVLLGGFVGFSLAIYNLLLPVLHERGFDLPPLIPRWPSFLSLPSLLNRGEADDDEEWDDLDDFKDPDTRRFAGSTFSARKSLLSFRRREPELDEEDEYDDEEEGELLGSLYSEALPPRAAARLDDDDEDDLEELDEELAELITAVAEEVAAEPDAEDEEDGDEDDDDEDEDDDDEEDEEEPAAEQPVVQVVAAGGGTDDFLALFGEGAEEAKVVQAWRADLPDNTSIEELLAEARAMREMLQGKKRPAA